MSRFDEAGASTYDDRIKKLIPGYDLLHQLTAAQLKVLLPQNADILVVGAGTGKEIQDLAHVNENWNFLALDPSEEMLSIARSSFEDQGIINRVSFHKGEVSSLELGKKFDAALSLFVMHFIHSFSEKRNFLSDIREVLKDEALLFLADLMKPSTEKEQLAQGEAAKMMGLSEDKKQTMLSNLETDFHALNSSELKKLLHESGFGSPVYYFQALRFKGCWAYTD